MSHNYLCDCCGENLYEFEEVAIGHFKTIDSEKDYCPWCAKYISEHIDSAITMLDAILLANEHDAYNDKYKK